MLHLQLFISPLVLQFGRFQTGIASMCLLNNFMPALSCILAVLNSRCKNAFFKARLELGMSFWIRKKKKTGHILIPQHQRAFCEELLARGGFLQPLSYSGLEPTSRLALTIIAAHSILLHAYESNALGRTLVKHSIQLSPPFRGLGGKLHSLKFPSWCLMIEACISLYQHLF